MFNEASEPSSASGLRSSAALGLSFFTALVLWKSRAGEDPAGEHRTRGLVRPQMLVRAEKETR